jgi:hypothetical protein
MIGAGELIVLGGLVALLWLALSPLRRHLEAAFARLLGVRTRRRRGKVVVLERRRDGTFGREGPHDG